MLEQIWLDFNGEKRWKCGGAQSVYATATAGPARAFCFKKQFVTMGFTAIQDILRNNQTMKLKRTALSTVTLSSTRLQGITSGPAEAALGPVVRSRSWFPTFYVVKQQSFLPRQARDKSH
jgi:hypothetical protein